LNAVLSPDDRWDRLQPPCDPTNGLSGNRKWMDGWMDGNLNATTIKDCTIPTKYSTFLYQLKKIRKTATGFFRAGHKTPNNI